MPYRKCLQRTVNKNSSVTRLPLVRTYMTEIWYCFNVQKLNTFRIQTQAILIIIKFSHFSSINSRSNFKVDYYWRILICRNSTIFRLVINTFLCTPKYSEWQNMEYPKNHTRNTEKHERLCSCCAWMWPNWAPETSLIRGFVLLTLDVAARWVTAFVSVGWNGKQLTPPRWIFKDFKPTYHSPVRQTLA